MLYLKGLKEQQAKHVEELTKREKYFLLLIFISTPDASEFTIYLEIS